MALAVVHSRASIGVDAPLITVEVHLSNGLPAFNIVGLPDASIREAKERVRSALLNSQFEFPAKRITVNLAPADLPKDGGRFDLAIAVGIIAATGQIPNSKLEQLEVVGELALSGEVRPITGILPAALATKKAGKRLVLPLANANEAALVTDLSLKPAKHLLALYQYLMDKQDLVFTPAQPPKNRECAHPDLQDIVGQAAGKRALEIAAAGGHNILFYGPPGTGKTMLANRLSSLLPELNEDEAIESLAIASIANQKIDEQLWRKRPFRHPHHTSSAVALVGGGATPRPGEISLAHNGVLFLDELPEFERKVLDVLREPLESGEVSIARAARQTTFPAKFQLVAAMNPSPTGDAHDGRIHSDAVLRYLNRLSGPLLERIDIQAEVSRLPEGRFSEQIQERGESSYVVKQRVNLARDTQLRRAGKLNCELQSKEIDRFCELSPTLQHFLEEASQKLHLSIRSYHRILKVARTIADLESNSQIQRQHLAEAMGYRGLERLIEKLKRD